MTQSKCWTMLLALLWLMGIAPAAQALDMGAVKQRAAEDSDIKIEAINKLVTSGDAAVIPIFNAMQDDALHAFRDRILIATDTGFRDAQTGQAIDVGGDAPESIVINNRIRGALDSALAVLKLLAPERDVRLLAARAVALDANAEMLPLIQRAVAQETDAEVKALLAQASAASGLLSSIAALELK